MPAKKKPAHKKGGKKKTVYKVVVRRRGGAEAAQVVEAVQPVRSGLAGKLFDLAKDTKIISKTADKFGAPQWFTDGVQRLGYGKPKKTYIVHRVR